MVTQITPKGSLAADVALVPLVAAKLQAVQESSRPAKPAENAYLTAASPPGKDGRSAGVSGKDLEAAAKEVSEHLHRSGSKLEIDYDKTSGRNVFKVVDSATGDIVFQIPSEELLAAARKLRESDTAQDAPGVLVDKEG